jgi:hypothetical protein
MSTTVFATEYHDHAGTHVTLADNDRVTLVRDGAMSRRSSQPRHMLDSRDIIAETSLRAWLDGAVQGDEDELNTAIACTTEEDDGVTVLVPFTVQR